jgi:phosphohistidine phosphatase
MLPVSREGTAVKTLLLLRHAKAEAEAARGDKGRALTARGCRDAATIGWYLRARAARPDRIVTSRARRARQTAAIVGAAAEFRGPVHAKRGLYYATPAALLRRVRRLPEKAACVLLVGHNPDLEELAALLVGPGGAVPALPTAGLLRLDFNVPRWRDIRPGDARCGELQTPAALVAQAG